MRAYKPSDLLIVSKRDPKRAGLYEPSSYLRLNNNGELEQMWWSDRGDAVWETLQTGDVSLRDIALGRRSRRQEPK